MKKRNLCSKIRVFFAWTTFLSMGACQSMDNNGNDTASTKAQESQDNSCKNGPMDQSSCSQKEREDRFKLCMLKGSDRIEHNELQCRIYAAAGENEIHVGQAKTLFGEPNTMFWPYNPGKMAQPKAGIDGECGINFFVGHSSSDDTDGPTGIISNWGSPRGRALLAWFKQTDKNRRRIETYGYWIEYNKDFKITSYGYDFNAADRAQGQTIPALGTPIWVCNLR